MKTVFIVIALALLTGCASSPPAPQNILVLPVYQDARGDISLRAYRQASNGMAREFISAGHNVLDETLLTVDQFSPGYRGSRAEAMDIAQGVSRPPVDVLVLYSLQSSSQRAGSSRTLGADAQMLNVGSGRVMGSADTERRVRLPYRCDPRCALDETADVSRQLGAELGATLVAILGKASPEQSGRGDAEDRSVSPLPCCENNLETAFDITLDGFTPEEVMQIEDGLRRIRGFETLRYSLSSHRRAEIWYETLASSAYVQRELRGILRSLGLRHTLQFAGNALRVSKITTRGGADLSADGIHQW